MIERDLKDLEADLEATESEALREVKSSIRYCRDCYNYAEGDLCRICADRTISSATSAMLRSSRMSEVTM